MEELAHIDFDRLRDIAGKHRDVFPDVIEQVDELSSAGEWELQERQRLIVTEFRERLDELVHQEAAPEQLLGYLMVLSVLGDRRSVQRIRLSLLS